jgi:hypothetical protein
MAKDNTALKEIDTDLDENNGMSHKIEATLKKIRINF